MSGGFIKRMEEMKSGGVYGDGDSFVDVVAKLVPEYRERQKVREDAFEFVKRSILEAMDKFVVDSQFRVEVYDRCVEVTYPGSRLVISPLTDTRFAENQPLVIVRDALTNAEARECSPLVVLKGLSTILPAYVIGER